MKIIRLLRRCHLPLLLLLAAFAPLVLILCRFAPEAAARLALFPVICALMLLGCAAVPGRVRIMMLGTCFVLLMGAGFLLLPHRVSMYAMPVCSAVVLFCALSYADRSASDVPPPFYVAGVIMQLTAQFLLRSADSAVRGALTLPLQGAFLVWLLLLLLAFNRISLNNATLSRFRLSAGMARTGTALTVCVFSLSLLLSAMPAVVSGIKWLFRTLRTACAQILLFLINLFPAESVGGSMGSGAPMLPDSILMTASEPSLLAVVLEKIASLLSMAVLFVGSVILLRMLALALLRLMRRLLLRLQRYAAAVTEDYEDEITDTRGEDGEHSFHPLRRRAKRAMMYPDTPAGRIRRRYAQLLARHPAWPVSSTARENLSPDAASLYERARYSDHALTEDEAQRFDQNTHQ